MYREQEVEYGGSRFYVREMGAFEFYRAFGQLEGKSDEERARAMYQALRQCVQRKRFGIKCRAFWTVRGVLKMPKGCLAALSEAFKSVNGVSDPNE